MLTEGQALYLEEVLGTSLKSWQQPSTVPHYPLLVLTPKLSSSEAELLHKIFSNASLPIFHHQAIEAASLGQLPEGLTASHVFVFFDGVPVGRHPQTDGSTWWGLHSLQSMIGENAEVAQNKRAVWTLIQQFQKERARA